LHTAGPFIGDVANLGFRDVLPPPRAIVASHHGMLSVLAVAIVAGAVVERGRILPLLFFFPRY